MDTEKYIKQQKYLDEGKSPSDEGPYYHHTWWESYKGGVKGKFGGLTIGALVGATVGAAVAGLAALLAGPEVVISSGLVFGTMGSFAGAGLLYGAHEFGDVGKVTGAVSAGLQQVETRMKASEGIEFAKIKQEIRELKSLVKGEPIDTQTAQDAAAQETAQTAPVAYDDQDYRKSHYAKMTPPDVNTFAFWKVALVGLVVGAAAGLLLGLTDISGDILHHAFGEAAKSNPLLDVLLHNATAASTIVFGALGASFGINRDAFRKIFDKTDLWFKGITHGKGHELVREQQVNAGMKIEQELNGHAPKAEAVATAVVPDEPANTQWREAVLAQAQQALQELNPTGVTRH